MIHSVSSTFASLPWQVYDVTRFPFVRVDIDRRTVFPRGQVYLELNWLLSQDEPCIIIGHNRNREEPQDDHFDRLRWYKRNIERVRRTIHGVIYVEPNEGRREVLRPLVRKIALAMLECSCEMMPDFDSAEFLAEEWLALRAHAHCAGVPT